MLRTTGEVRWQLSVVSFQLSDESAILSRKSLLKGLENGLTVSLDGCKRGVQRVFDAERDSAGSI
jgi:hypothetical protein